MNKWKFIEENYINRGLKIFPIVPNGKTPLIEKWQENCSCDFFQVLYWYENCPNCNWGLPCTPNNLFVLDLDRHDPNKDGVINYNKLKQKIGEYSYAGLEQETPSNGVHIIFESNDILKNVSNSSNIFKDYPGIDCRSDGYIVVEPSVINNKYYHIVSRFEDKKPKKMPIKLQNYIVENANLKSDIKKQPYEKPKVVEKGDRDNQLFSYINNIYFKTRLDYDEILCLANYFNENVLEEPLPKKTVEYKTKKVFDKDRGKVIFINLGE